MCTKLGILGSSHPSLDSCKEGSAPKMIVVANHLVFGLCSVERANSWLQSNQQREHLLNRMQAYVDAEGQLGHFDPPGLSDFYEFFNHIINLETYKEGKMLFLCCGSNPKNITFNAALAGGFLMLNHLLGLDEVIRAFEPLCSHVVDFDDQLTVKDCWSALHYASRHCGWLNLDFSESKLEPGTLDMEEYVHYDSPLNGSLHSLIPDKLLVFNRPYDLPGGADWADVGATRRFSAAYYAEIFCDFDVGVVIRVIDEIANAAYDADAFAKQGIDVVDLPIVGDGVPTLAQIDCFLTLARKAPGAVAVHGGGGGAGLGAAGALIAAHLIGAYRFPAAEAVAWVRMVHPAADPRRHRGFLLANAARIAA